MKLQHTPGPWRVETCDEGEKCWCRIIVSEHPDYEGDESENGYYAIITPGALRKHNASLIAAAPDMLEALLKTRAYLLTVDCVFMDPEESAGQMLVAEIDDVIERATGLTIKEVMEHE